jgi:hypothetical protein
LVDKTRKTSSTCVVEYERIQRIKSRENVFYESNNKSIFYYMEATETASRGENEPTATKAFRHAGFRIDITTIAEWWGTAPIRQHVQPVASERGRPQTSSRVQTED